LFILGTTGLVVSGSAGSWHNESNYEVLGDICVDAPLKSFQMRQKLGLLFGGMKFALCGNFAHPHPSRKTVTKLILLGGGEVVSGSEGGGDKVHCLFIPSSADAKLISSFANSKNNVLLSIVWLMDSIVGGEVLGYEDYSMNESSRVR
jgi:hypothetical protein